MGSDWKAQRVDAVSAIRAATPDDAALVLLTWRTKGPRRGVDRHIAEALMDGVARLSWRSLSVIVVHPESDSECILGWLAHDGEAVHACYVRPEARGLGYAKELFAASGAKRISAWPLPHKAPGWRQEPWRAITLLLKAIPT